jgi:transcriptional regulator with XRE-family HTH domain
MPRPLPSPAAQVIGRRLRERRHQLGLTLADVADPNRLSQSTVSAIERGLNEPSVRVLAAICRALDLSLDELLDDEPVAS